MTPSMNVGGVDETLTFVMAQLRVSRATRSLKVPPMSTAAMKRPMLDVSSPGALRELRATDRRSMAGSLRSLPTRYAIKV
jgi:hypothetical protein